MSQYAELQAFVAVIASDAAQQCRLLANCAESVEKFAAEFRRLTATTRGDSAGRVEISFYAAEKQLLLAANALQEAAQAGAAWSGATGPELKYVLKQRQR